MKKLFIPFLAAAFLAGCHRGDVWTHETKTHQDFLKDDIDCKAKAGQAVPAGENRYYNLTGSKSKRSEFVQECLEAQGWTRN